jgi:hypothetical protein
MTLTLELTPDEEARLEQAARVQGRPVEALLRAMIAQLPDAEARRRELVASLRGRFADMPTTVDDFLREKHADIAREESRK